VINVGLGPFLDVVRCKVLDDLGCLRIVYDVVQCGEGCCDCGRVRFCVPDGGLVIDDGVLFVWRLDGSVEGDCEDYGTAVVVDWYCVRCFEWDVQLR